MSERAGRQGRLRGRWLLWALMLATPWAWACGDSAAPMAEGGLTEGGPPDAAREGGGEPDGGPLDAGPVEAGEPEGGPPDAGPPEAPLPPEVEPVGARAVHVRWEAPAGPELRVERTAAGEVVLLAPLEGATEILDHGLEPGTAVGYRLCRVTGGAAPPCSEPVAVVLPASELGASMAATVAFPEGREGADDLVLFAVLDLDTAATFGAVVLVDRAGHIVWEHVDTRDGLISDVELLDDGSLMVNQFAELRLMDVYLRPLRRYANRDPARGAPPAAFADVTVPTDRDYHHDAHPFGADAWLALAFTVRHDDATGLDLLGDVVSIFDATTGEERWSVDLFDVYDHTTTFSAPDLAMDFLGRGRDWSHSNAVWFDEARSELYVNVRNLDRIAVLDYPSGALVREVGDGGRSFAHSHDPEYEPDGSVLVFDNGLHRTGGGLYSRAVQLRESPGGLEVVWEYRETPDFFAPVFGDADRLASGDTLVTIGSTRPARLVEADASGARVWELTLSPPARGIYNAQLVPAATWLRLCGLRAAP